MCGLCAVALSELFQEAGHYSKPYSGWFYVPRPGDDAPYMRGHCWVEDDDFIFDVTATQFGDFPAILIWETPNKHYSEPRHLVTRDTLGHPKADPLVPFGNQIAEVLALLKQETPDALNRNQKEEAD